MNKEKKPMRAQTATEYLIIVAIVIIIALIVVTALGGVTSIGTDSSALIQYQTLTPLAISSWTSSDTSGTVITVKNTGNEPLQFTNFQTNCLNMSPGVTLGVGEQFKIVFPGNYKPSQTGFSFSYTMFSSNAQYSFNSNQKMNSICNGILLGLNGYWKFENNLLDSSRLNNHLSLINNTQYYYTNSPFGRAVGSFAGGRFNSNITTNITSGITMSAWVVPNTLIDHVFPFSFNSQEAVLYCYNTSNCIALALNQTAAQYNTGQYALNNNTFTHIALTYSNNTGSLNFYVNGTLKQTTAVIGFARLQSGYFGILGSPSLIQPFNTFNGTIAEAMAWNRTLSSAEILQLYQLAR
jgi:hypothetical protein